MSYTLVNPYIVGKFDKSFDGKTPLAAADKAYNALSKYFNNNIPKFYFTLQEGGQKNILEDTSEMSDSPQIGGSSKFHHFVVKEKKEGNDANYTISEYNISNTKHLNTFAGKLNNFRLKQSGGLRDLDDSSSSMSDSDSSSSLSDLKGGKHHGLDDSSSSSSDSWLEDEDDHLYKKKFKLAPISYWWYDPQVYFLKKIYIPTFVSTITPYVQLDLFF